MYLADNRELYISIVFYDVVSRHTCSTASKDWSFGIINSRRILNSELHCCLLVGWAGHYNGEVVLLLDLHIIEHGSFASVKGICILEIGDVLVVGAGGYQDGDQ